MRILVVEDHALFRDALTLLLRDWDSSSAVVSVPSCEEAFDAVARYADLDLILLDLGLPGIGGLAAIPELLVRAPAVPVVVLSAEENPRIIGEALSAGAAGFIPKTTRSEEMKAALRLVFGGEVYVPPVALGLENSERQAARTADANDDLVLTKRQQEVLKLLSFGLSNKSIAHRLNLSEGTVKLHVTAILRKLDADNRTSAVREAQCRGLLGAVPG